MNRVYAPNILEVEETLKWKDCIATRQDSRPDAKVVLALLYGMFGCVLPDAKVPRTPNGGPWIAYHIRSRIVTQASHTFTVSVTWSRDALKPSSGQLRK